MSEQDATTAVDESTADSAQTEATATEATTPGTESLGDAGKQALDRMKTERNAARAEAKRLADEFAALRAQVEGREAEHKATLEAQRVKDEALSAANQRILKAEIKAASAGKLADPLDALRFLDLGTFEVGDDGDVDSSAIASAIDELITDKPYLAAQGSRFKGEADGGARKERPESDIDADIAAATAAGNHLQAIALKQQRAALLAHTS